MTHMVSSPALVMPNPHPDAKFRLICLPYAGASPTIFHAWSHALAPDIEVAGVQLPGHGSRYRETPLTRLNGVVEMLADVLEGYLDKPYILFGQSLGALTSFELAREFRRRGQPTPSHFFACARPAPHLPNEWMPIHKMPDDLMVKEVQRRYGGIPQAILADPELMQLFLPVLRADLEILETYDYLPEAPLSCDITVYGGYQDWAVADDQLDAWAEHTTGVFSQEMFPGNHFFVQNTPAFFKTFSSHLAAIGV